ncbi:MAG: signal peptidase I, partial [Nitrosopumilus sp. (ex Thoosa mismalolli)]|nr:signal peptidase I [Nitrosopumilus sp. (ex Thoosa mismalolli)]
LVLGLSCISLLVINTGIIETWPPVLVAVMPTNSMSPHIEPGDIYTINRSVDFQDIQTGDVVVYKLDCCTGIAHRVIEIRDTELITKGDFNLYMDPYPVTEMQYMGIVDKVHEIKFLNQLLNHLPMDELFSSNDNRILLMVVVVSCTIFVVVWNKQRKLHKDGL